MKTTIDLPDDVLRRAEVVAVQRKMTLDDLVIQGLELATGEPTPSVDRERKARAEQLLAALGRIQITEPVGTFRRDEIYDRHRGRWE